MTKQDLRIIFLGTPDFATASLRALVEGGYNVVAVVTMPDKPAGRGHQLQFSDVKKYALSVGLPVLQPERLKDETFLEQLRSYQADLQIVVAFRMLPEVGNATIRHIQSTRQSITPIPWSSTHQLGNHQWRQRDRCHHFHAQA